MSDDPSGGGGRRGKERSTASSDGELCSTNLENQLSTLLSRCRRSTEAREEERNLSAFRYKMSSSGRQQDNCR